MTDVSIEGHMVPVEDLPPREAVLPSEYAPPLSEAPETIVKEDKEATHLQPDTPIEVTPSTTVIVQTDTETVRDYALMFRTHLYNGGKKAIGFVSFLKARLSEKTTYVFLGTGIAAASALPAPWSYASMGVSFIAAMVPDHVIMDGNGNH